jgi:hypothetical protein
MHLGKAPHWAWVVVAGVVGRHIVLEVFLMLVSGVLRACLVPKNFLKNFQIPCHINL